MKCLVDLSRLALGPYDLFQLKVFVAPSTKTKSINRLGSLYLIGGVNDYFSRFDISKFYENQCMVADTFILA